MTVRENIANPRFPTHIVGVAPQPNSHRTGSLIFRCENNRTEAFLNFDGVYGHRGTLRVRWAGMDRATRIGAEDSTTGQAAFISNPIAFIARMVEEGSVILDVEGYTARGTGQYRLTKTVDAIYALASTCEWETRLPPRKLASGTGPRPASDPAAAPAVSGPERSPPPPAGDRREIMSELALRLYFRDLKPEVEKYGLDRVSEILRETMVNYD
ncbi:hypothetical protein [Celeribacter indicus]|uniref:Uncharacterized protein n=1 Tax=Celeribacter indicus TaxID=1208324 RepID=A0A0B5E1V5_9RHOB|nr:hypothetical protein [Celeribacter indicus]AJE46452.1 hypothetical protein P73_1737 [Celeribacter indicus]SDW57067.1 hypothetical protein SAMN05443573_104293 [Celeribacter indicus]